MVFRGIDQEDWVSDLFSSTRAQFQRRRDGQADMHDSHPRIMKKLDRMLHVVDRRDLDGSVHVTEETSSRNTGGEDEDMQHRDDQAEKVVRGALQCWDHEIERLEKEWETFRESMDLRIQRSQEQSHEANAALAQRVVVLEQRCIELEQEYVTLRCGQASQEASSTVRAVTVKDTEKNTNDALRTHAPLPQLSGDSAAGGEGGGIPEAKASADKAVAGSDKISGSSKDHVSSFGWEGGDTGDPSGSCELRPGGSVCTFSDEQFSVGGGHAQLSRRNDPGSGSSSPSSTPATMSATTPMHVTSLSPLVTTVTVGPMIQPPRPREVAASAVESIGPGFVAASGSQATSAASPAFSDVAPGYHSASECSIQPIHGSDVGNSTNSTAVGSFEDAKSVAGMAFRSGNRDRRRTKGRPGDDELPEAPPSGQYVCDAGKSPAAPFPSVTLACGSGMAPAPFPVHVNHQEPSSFASSTSAVPVRHPLRAVSASAPSRPANRAGSQVLVTCGDLGRWTPPASRVIGTLPGGMACPPPRPASWVAASPSPVISPTHVTSQSTVIMSQFAPHNGQPSGSPSHPQQMLGVVSPTHTERCKSPHRVPTVAHSSDMFDFRQGSARQSAAIPQFMRS